MKIENLASAQGSAEPASDSRSAPRRKGGSKPDPQLGLKVITDIRGGVKNPNRANIFLNDKFAFSLDITQLADFHLKIGQALTAEEIATYKQASDFGKLYQRALEWVFVRPRSLRELSDYLTRKVREKKLDPAYIDRILDRLVDKGYVDDAKFATYYLENRFVKKGISKKRLVLELRQKGVAEDIIEAAFAESPRDEVEEAKKIIAKKRAKYDDEKLMAYLCRQGFSYQLVRSLIQNSETD